jgi:ABC-type Fe3+/spermidine/putrescine transport system ATPase subunit
MMGALRFSGITKFFGAVRALEPLDLDVAEGEFLTLLGPSGSGKTTLLNICAGYLPPTGGRLFVDDVDVTDLPPRARNMGMVFQNYALFPHMTVGENVAYGLKARRCPADEIRRRVDQALGKVQLSGYGSRPVGNLSGGQQQRVALARAMVIEPDILLMDEPLGALDRQLRKDVQLEIRRMHVANPKTTIYVTHDQEEALVMSDRIAVMRGGRIVQIGSGRDLYERPVDSFVARFLGESNLLPGRVMSVSGGRATIAIVGIENPVVGRAGDDFAIGQTASMLIRPENVRHQAGGIAARVVEVVYLGELTALRLAIGAPTPRTKPENAGPRSGADTSIELWSRQNNWEASVGDVVEVGWEAESVSILRDITP